MECATDEPIAGRIRPLVFRALAAGFGALAAYYFWRARYPEETNTALMWALSICIGVGGVSVTTGVIKFAMRILAKGVNIHVSPGGEEDDDK